MILVATDIEVIESGDDPSPTFGGKAAGFLTIPAAWRPPALFIGSAFYEAYLAGATAFETVASEIWPRLAAFRTATGFDLIVRSSATDESIKERGQFKSIRLPTIASITDFTSLSAEIFDHYKGIGAKQMCLIAQCYFNGVETGFLSNEIRLVDKPYRWIVERHLSAAGSIQQESISAKQANDISSTEPLVCLSRQELKSRLRAVAKYFWKLSPSQRMLLEWVWDGAKLWLVQRDNETLGTEGRDPERLIGASFEPPLTDIGTVFTRYDVGSSTPWPKLKNVTDFATGGRIPSHRLFYATASSIAKSLGTPTGLAALVAEIDALTRGRAVVRTDALERRYNLPRTNTVTGAKAVGWLRKQLETWRQRSVAMDDVAFILHSYIPARAAAWSYHRRGSPVVRIDALWGLADGMQYYPTDTFVCLASDGKKISETLRYKELVLLEQPDGRWVTDHIAPKFARHRVLSTSEQVDIATRTREISDNLDIDVQIMWFVDIPNEFGFEPNIPWFKITPEQDVEERKSHLLASIKIRSAEDLSKVAGAAPASVKVILEPSGEDLRSDEFIDAVGAVCAKLKLPVELRGSILSHAFHQLRKANVQVYSAEPGKSPLEMRQRKAFDKLVRDQIPENIEAKGESVDAEELDPKELSLALVGKLFEEAEEYLAADSGDAKLDELADLFEIVRALADASNVALDDVMMRADVKRKKRGGFNRGVILRSTSVLAATKESQDRELFEGQETRRKITLSALADAQSAKRRDTPVTALLTGEPRALQLSLPGGLELTLSVELAGGIISVSVVELIDQKEESQQKLI